MADRSHAEYQDGRKPPERVPKSERILNLIAVLLRADRPVPVTEILGKVTGYNDYASRESLMRRFERDKKVLRDIGIPIEHSTQGTFGQEGYSISRRDYFLDELRLPPESGQILRLLYAWAHADGGSLSADLRSALVKLGFLVPSNGQQPLKATESLAPQPKSQAKAEVSQAGSVSGALLGKNLEVLSEAVLRRRRVRFRYYTMGRDEENEVEVDPYGLGFSGQAWNRPAWYLVGYSHLREAVRVFKVQRIRNEVALVRPADSEEADFEAPLGFRVKEHLGKTRWEYQDLAAAFGGESSEEPFTARVGFEKAIAPEIHSLVPSSREVAKRVKGALKTHEYLEFEVKQKRPFLRFLLRFVPRVHVAQPEGLEDELRSLAREVLERYQEAS